MFLITSTYNKKLLPLTSVEQFFQMLVTGIEPVRVSPPTGF